jgi:hypothetical protein
VAAHGLCFGRLGVGVAILVFLPATGRQPELNAEDSL